MTRASLIATLLVFAVGAPVTFVFARAVADATERSQQAPFRAILGNDRFDELMDGEGGFPHYLGSDLLAPDFTLLDRYGKPWSLKDQRGKVVVMNFWTVTCRPCLREMPMLERLARVAQGWGDVEVVAVSTDENFEVARPVVGDQSKMIHVFDPERAVVTDTFGTKLFPETWIIDKEGVVRLRFDGALDWASPVALDLIRAYR